MIQCLLFCFEGLAPTLFVLTTGDFDTSENIINMET